MGDRKQLGGKQKKKNPLDRCTYYVLHCSYRLRPRRHILCADLCLRRHVLQVCRTSNTLTPVLVCWVSGVGRHVRHKRVSRRQNCEYTLEYGVVCAGLPQSSMDRLSFVGSYWSVGRGAG